MDDDKTFPTILTTSKLFTTGVNCKICKCIVLDNTSGEQGMTEFKQIISCGTRIKENKGKLYFTVLDFKKATLLFADPDFDDEPLVVYDPSDSHGAPVGPVGPPAIIIAPPDDPPKSSYKYYVTDLEVEVTGAQVQYYWMGKLHTESLVDYTRKNMRSKFPTLDDFVQKWNSEDKKAAICGELEKQGVFLDHLRDQTGRDDLDDFELICHIAYDVPVMTRRERARAIGDSGYLDQFNEAAEKVLEALLDKYADTQIRDLDDIEIQLKEFQQIGSVPKIVKMSGGKDQFLHAAQALENEFYRVVAYSGGVTGQSITAMGRHSRDRCS